MKPFYNALVGVAAPLVYEGKFGLLPYVMETKLGVNFQNGAYQLNIVPVVGVEFNDGFDFFVVVFRLPVPLP